MAVFVFVAHVEVVYHEDYLLLFRWLQDALVASDLYSAFDDVLDFITVECRRKGDHLEVYRLRYPIVLSQVILQNQAFASRCPAYEH